MSDVVTPSTAEKPDELLTEGSYAIRKKHPAWIRWAHWLNFPVLLIMLWSGVLIYWANPAYWPELPDGFYNSLHLDHRLALGLAFHFSFMWLFAINGLLYVVYLIASGEWRELVPTLRSFPDAFRVVLHDLGLRKDLPQQGKFNGAQRIAYTGVILLGALAVGTGVSIYKPIQLTWIKQIFGGYEAARLIHYLVAVSFILFFIVHVAQVIRAGWNNFRAMVAGFEVVESEKQLD